MEHKNVNVTRELFCAPIPYWQPVNTRDGLRLIYSKLNYAACTIHLENCFNLEVEYDS